MPTLDEDEDDDKLSRNIKNKRKKKRSTEKSAGSGAGSGSGSGGGFSCIPTTVVCSSADAVHTPGAVELAVLVIGLVFALYFYGVYETLLSLPDVPTMPNFRHHRGENLNLAIGDFECGGAALLRRRRRRGKKNQKKNKQGKLTPTANGNTKKKKKKGGAGAVIAAAAAIDVEIPPTKPWPVSVRGEVDDYETLIHPGDRKTEMKVPKFWSRPVHGGGLMSRETALKIGSCSVPDPTTGSYARGDTCPADQRTILILIASYRDFQCRDTLESAFARAQHPDRVRVAVVDQIVSGEDNLCDEPKVACEQDQNQALCKYKDQIDVYEMDAALSVGPVFARHIGYRMYRGEYYATQSDAHVTFTRNWDVDIVSQLEQTHNEMAVLSTYLTDVQGSIDKNGDSVRKTRPIMCNTKWEGGPQGMHLRHGSQPERLPSIHGEPQLSPWWAAGYSFSRGHFVVNVPYDYLQPMIFQGEEMSIGIRGFTIGYDYYAPERSVCFHHYAVGKNAKVRNSVHHFWENDRQFTGTGARAMKRLLGIVHMNPEVPKTDWEHTDEDVYGIGKVRTPEKFYELYGINVKKKNSVANLCNFVDEGRGLMHTQFTPFLRKDGMGIDYTHIHFQWTDPFAPVLPKKMAGKIGQPKFEVKKEGDEKKKEADADGDDDAEEDDDEEDADGGDDDVEDGEEWNEEGGDEDGDDVEEGDGGGDDDPDMDDADVVAAQELAAQAA